MPDLGLAEGLAHAVRRRHQVTIHQRHLQAASVAMDQHRLVQVRQARGDRAAIATAADYQYPNRPAQQFGRQAMRHRSPPLDKLQQSFTRVCQELHGKGLSTPRKSAAQSQETAREARQTCGAISMSELALEKSTLPAFYGIYTRRLWNAHCASADLAGIITVPERRRSQFRLASRSFIFAQCPKR